MLTAILTGLMIITINVIVQAFSTIYFFRIFIPQYQRKAERTKTIYPSLWMLVYLVSFLTLLHASQCTLWAATYYFDPSISDLDSFEQAIYFSLITFTTIGYGDVTIDSEWRILAGLEGINGIMLIGWSTAMVFAFLQVLFRQNWDTLGLGLKEGHKLSPQKETDNDKKTEDD
ncbi:potassium channel family protein [Sphingobacterium yanglingense]|uniref:Ion channel n=1 Tax=Sphingobacterium yanglingense TaxID=1437280 RepID=A0A4R6W485_9SPHI|nr:potassium channel family protein [Sphingobacterium yanglingense]TDQ72289.1 ion channel [Sphingobacterium yanglingense]